MKQEQNFMMGVATMVALILWSPFGDVTAKDTELIDQSRVIYGSDDRREVGDPNNDPNMVRLARSTVALVRDADIIDVHDDNGDEKSIMKRIKSQSFGDAMGLCSTEPFFEQPSGAFCSGFLVGPNLIATAGHCIRSQASCAHTAFVFDFDYRAEKDSSVVKENDVYYCQELLAYHENSNGADFAIVRINRSVNDRSPVEIRRDGEIEIGEGVTVIGHPSGIPTKIAGGAFVRTGGSNGHFVANLDTYGGNSGSAVFNSKTGLVEGILVRGATDFVMEGSCRVSNVCPTTGCMGEHITRAPRFAEEVPALAPLIVASQWQIAAEFGNENDALDPGEDAHVSLVVKNVGVGDANAVSLHLSTDHAGVLIGSEGPIMLASLGQGEEFRVEDILLSVAKDVACGARFSITIEARYDGKLSSQSQHEFTIGSELIHVVDVTPDAEITDASSDGIFSTIDVPFAPNGAPIKVAMDIEHSYVGDLEIKLTSPKGDSMWLWNRSGGAQDNIVGVFGDDLEVESDLSFFDDVDEPGVWTLWVADLAPRDEGKLRSWGLKTVSYTCESVDE